MQMTSFLQDKKLTIALCGEIDHHGAKNVLRSISEKIEQFMPVTCVLDFRDVSFMDSSGIAIVIHTYRRMLELNGELCLKRVPDQPRKVFEAAGLNKIISIEGRITVYEG